MTSSFTTSPPPPPSPPYPCMPPPAPSPAASAAGHLPAGQLHHLDAPPSPAPQHFHAPLSPCPTPAPVRRARWPAGIWSKSPSATAAGHLRPLDPPGGGRPPPPHPARITLSFLQLSPRRARSLRGAPPPAMEAARAESAGTSSTPSPPLALFRPLPSSPQPPSQVAVRRWWVVGMSISLLLVGR
jgi:hypothetical protein